VVGPGKETVVGAMHKYCEEDANEAEGGDIGEEEEVVDTGTRTPVRPAEPDHILLHIIVSTARNQHAGDANYARNTRTMPAPAPAPAFARAFPHVLTPALCIHRRELTAVDPALLPLALIIVAPLAT